jgi:FtsH-binding integral membrane protein
MRATDHDLEHDDDTRELDATELRTERWCAGLRFSCERPQTDRERTILARNIADLTSRMHQCWGLAAATTIVPLAAPFVFRKPQQEWLAVAIVVSLVLLFFVGTAFTLLRIRDLAKVRGRFQDDLDGGVMLSFEGSIDPGESLHEDQKRLFDLGVLRPEPGAEQRVDVLPATGAVLAPISPETVRFVPVRVTEVAAGPEYAMRVAVPRNMAWIDGDPDAEIARRTLNVSERAELDHHVRRLRKPSIWVALWLAWVTCWVLAATFSPVATLAYARSRWVLVAIQTVFLGLVLAQYLRALHLARLLERDTDTGWALTLERTAPDAESADEAAAAPVPARCVEFLPHSRAVWNEQGKPARWRHLGRRAA